MVAGADPASAKPWAWPLPTCSARRHTLSVRVHRFSGFASVCPSRWVLPTPCALQGGDPCCGALLRIAVEIEALEGVQRLCNTTQRGEGRCAHCFKRQLWYATGRQQLPTCKQSLGRLESLE